MMEERDPDKLREKFAAVDRIIECPVCLGRLRPPVVLCDNGHGLCGECKQSLDQCPVCKGGFTSNNISVALAQLLESLPRHCKHKTSGCSVFIPQENHDDFCIFRTTACNHCNGWTGPVEKLLPHVETDHPLMKIITDTSNSLALKDFTVLESRNSNTIFYIFGHIYWLHMRFRPQDKTLCTWFSRVFIENPRGSYFATVTFSKDDVRFEYTFDLSKPNNTDIDKQERMVIPIDTRLVQDKNKVGFTVKFFETCLK